MLLWPVTEKQGGKLVLRTEDPGGLAETMVHLQDVLAFPPPY